LGIVCQVIVAFPSGFVEAGMTARTDAKHPYKNATEGRRKQLTNLQG